MKEFAEGFQAWQSGGGFTVHLVGVVLIILAAFLVDRLLCRISDRTMRGTVARGENNRRFTLRKVVRSIIHYLIAFIAFVMILANLGVNIMSIIAAAGVLGLAVSFGAQSLIKDIFAGFFILFEDQYGIGEYITVNRAFTGFVETVDLRSTHLRGDDEELIIIPNGTITDVVNYSRGDFRVKLTFEISYESNIDFAEKVILEAAKQYYADHPDKMLREPVAEGLEVVGASGVSLSLFVYTQHINSFHVGRELRKVVVKALQKEGIEIPYPVTEVITKEKN